MPRGHSKTSPRNTTAMEREHKAVELRKAGATYDQIGENLGITSEAARKAVKRSMERVAALRDEA